MPRIKNENWNWIGFQATPAEKQILEDYCNQMQQTKTEVLRALIKSLQPNRPLQQSEDPWATHPLSSSQIRPWLHSLAAEANEDLALADKLRMTIEHLIEVERALRER